MRGGTVARSLIVAVLLAVAPGLGGCERPSGADAPYVPGLGEIMSATQMRHLKLWYAGQARNWPLAAYEVDELEEGFTDATRFHPTHKDAPRPLTELVPEFTAGPIAALRKAIAGESESEFVAAYDALTEGCNGCHASAHFPFNVITRPTANPYSDQRFAPSQ
jgi:hypothetical protein